jgi:hypothetical protein
MSRCSPVVHLAAIVQLPVNAVAMSSFARHVVAATIASMIFKDSTTVVTIIKANTPPRQPEKRALAIVARPN